MATKSNSNYNLLYDFEDITDVFAERGLELRLQSSSDGSEVDGEWIELQTFSFYGVSDEGVEYEGAIQLWSYDADDATCWANEFTNLVYDGISSFLATDYYADIEDAPDWEDIRATMEGIRDDLEVLRDRELAACQARLAKADEMAA